MAMPLPPDPAWKRDGAMMDEGAASRIISLIARDRLCVGCIAENAELHPDIVTNSSTASVSRSNFMRIRGAATTVGDQG
jgi:hypothetical protein